MEKQHALQQLEQLQKKLYAIHYACSAMNLDADTVAPKNTSEGRGVALGVLAGEEQQLMICPETRALLDELDRQKDELDLLHRREVEELRRRVRVFMRDRLLSSRIWDKDKQEELLNALLGEKHIPIDEEWSGYDE